MLVVIKKAFLAMSQKIDVFFAYFFHCELYCYRKEEGSDRPQKKSHESQPGLANHITFTDLYRHITSRRRSSWLGATASENAGSMRLVCIWYAFSLRLSYSWLQFGLHLTKSHRGKSGGFWFRQFGKYPCVGRFVAFVRPIAQTVKSRNEKVRSNGTFAGL